LTYCFFVNKAGEIFTERVLSMVKDFTAYCQVK